MITSYYKPSIKLYEELGKLIGDEMAFNAPNDMFESLVEVHDMAFNYEDADERKKGQELSRDFFDYLAKDICRNSDFIANAAYTQFYRNIR